MTSTRLHLYLSLFPPGLLAQGKSKGRYQNGDSTPILRSLSAILFWTPAKRKPPARSPWTRLSPRQSETNSIQKWWLVCTAT
ncbi:MAG: hypothetical protein A3F82_01780 [Deltaproteobacteria bacterium RIFCSPLOWO2_12_FULL_44_12]|nr:MAG: hypothetical protein A2712_03180 [Deltaproteobacteria bacterium RIFCSPHIGHO2_01_FULL_43_49]OGQ16196.1 MAG: hypothetical protein A3D22_01150 [Deltaproteobacteria bacterium RIFCSPHIGHO2_02_FULL_44_53]OGQ29156.1 MAG: hypothetical protein A3D98_04935 [Deltaproteobacteria bacterium RIFCSPHIGHO2_12_FULL_44_21]OGQ32713.1 MAG: hypothetical protein A2979_09080 [Deltaproteobacteria bacterium RIFCSPLOWO2_01_FULL_45_74]OGQ41815.1 MAG: hypothetical protein A3I70_08865 [Deltaproteobacteria bacterium 